jgi:hypothetical protein
MAVESKERVELDLDDDRGCDFCGCPPVTAYPAPPLSLAHTMTHVDGSRVEVASHNEGDWLACAPCQRLIERECYVEKGTDALCALHSPARQRTSVPVGQRPLARGHHTFGASPGGLQIW